jgi:hypothetical protein
MSFLMESYCLCKHVIKGLELEDDKYYGIALSVALLRSPALVEWSAIESSMSFGNVDCYWYLEYKAFTRSLPLYHFSGPHPAADNERQTRLSHQKKQPSNTAPLHPQFSCPI